VTNVQAVPGGAVRGVHPDEREGPRAERFEISLFSLILDLSKRSKPGRIDQVDHAQSGARGFVAVGRSDARLVVPILFFP